MDVVLGSHAGCRSACMHARNTTATCLSADQATTPSAGCLVSDCDRWVKVTPSLQHPICQGRAELQIRSGGGACSNGAISQRRHARPQHARSACPPLRRGARNRCDALVRSGDSMQHASPQHGRQRERDKKRERERVSEVESPLHQDESDKCECVREQGGRLCVCV
jgi:hypothetical protein